jgi:hypothetical protein
MVNITDGGGNLLTAQNFTSKWGETLTLSTSLTGLYYPVSVLLSTEVSKTKRSVLALSQKSGKRAVLIPPAIGDWKSWLVRITAGSTVWGTTDTDSKKLPYYKVEGWQNQNSSQRLISPQRGGTEGIPVRNFFSFHHHYSANNKTCSIGRWTAIGLVEFFRRISLKEKMQSLF